MYTVESLQERHDKRKRLILEIIRNEPGISRTEVKRASGLSMDSTLSLIAELLEEGLILAGEKADSGRAGRKATPLIINPRGCCFIGIRFSADGFTGLCLDFAHQIMCEKTVSVSEALDAQSMLERLKQMIQWLYDHRGDASVPLLGIGIGAPGLVDPNHGSILRYVHIANCENIPLRSELENCFRVPVFVQNGVRCSADFFRKKPENSALKNLVYVQTGRGISMSAYSDGQIVNGSGSFAGEIGHLFVSGGTELCACGNRGCLETVACSDALCRFASDGMKRHSEQFEQLLRTVSTGASFGIDDLLNCADLGDTGCRELLERAGYAVGLALSSVITIINPEAVVLCGRLSISCFYRNAFEQALREHTLPESLAGMQLHFADSDRKRDAIGAAELPSQMLFG